MPGYPETDMLKINGWKSEGDSSPFWDGLFSEVMLVLDRISHGRPASSLHLKCWRLVGAMGVGLRCSLQADWLKSLEICWESC